MAILKQTRKEPIILVETQNNFYMSIGKVVRTVTILNLKYINWENCPESDLLTRKEEVKIGFGRKTNNKTNLYANPELLQPNAGGVSKLVP